MFYYIEYDHVRAMSLLFLPVEEWHSGWAMAGLVSFFRRNAPSLLTTATFPDLEGRISVGACLARRPMHKV